MFVVQFKCNRWVNCKDDKGNTKYFNDVLSAYDYMGDKSPDYRVMEYLGNRKYKEV